MVCLAALELGDVKARDVRLFGSQLTPESLHHWQRLVEQGKVGSIQVYINEGDSIPEASFFYAHDIIIGHLQGDEVFPKTILINEIKERAPAMLVKILPCATRNGYFFDVENCHSMKTYQHNLYGRR
jgi:hypothetical protein